MPKVSMTTDLQASADDVWKLIGGFNALPDWHPAVEKSELKEEGQERILSLAGGGKIVERLEKINEHEREYSYSIKDSPLPVTNYTARLKVKDDGKGGSSVEWSSDFEAVGTDNEAMKVVENIYQTGFDNLRKMFGG
ncbi:MAG: SRPBCC family protein [Rhodospirillales bacterium]